MLPGAPIEYALWISIGAGFAAALVAWRARAEPGATSLTILLGGQAVWSVSLFFQLQATAMTSKIFWEELTWIGAVTIPVAWFVFALEFTGRDQYITRRSVAVLSILPVVTVGLALTSQAHTLLYAETALVSVQEQVFLQREPGAWFWVITGYSYLLGAAGTIPLLGLIQKKATVFRGQSAALLLGTALPWVSNFLYLNGLVPNPAFDPTPLAFCISGAAYLTAVLWFQLFTSSPAPSQYAHQFLLDQSHDGFLVIDTHDTVVEINDAAGRIFAVESATALGQPVDALCAGNSMFRHDSEPPSEPFHSDHTDTVYDVSQTRLTNSRGRTVGTVYLFRDVSQYIRTQQRHQVLNRLFRHNIRTQTNLITGYADLAKTGDLEDNISRIKSSAEQIERFSTKTREILSVFDREYASPNPAQLSTVIDTAIERTRAQYPSIAVEMEPIPGDVYVDDSLKTVFEQILSNAAEHVETAEPTVAIATDTDGTEISIEFTDNGPGISSYEQRVLEQGEENPLEHGSGLGLWLIKWGTEVVGGEIELRNTDRGATVQVDVPRLSTAEQSVATPE